MSHFLINLPDNHLGHVMAGKIRRMTFLKNLFRKNKLAPEEGKGYLVQVEDDKEGKKQYRLQRNQNGDWTTEDDGSFGISPDNDLIVYIKKAIDDYEGRH